MTESRLLTNPDLRDDAIRSVGCVACRLGGLGYCPCDKHHLNAHDMPGGKRRGERYTVGLCQWHHVGRCQCDDRMAVKRCATCQTVRGPSWVHDKRGFLTRYGSGDELLAVQDRFIIQNAQGILQ